VACQLSSEGGLTFRQGHKKGARDQHGRIQTTPHAKKRVRRDGAGGGKETGTPYLRRSERAGCQGGWQGADPPRNRIEAYGSVVNVVDAVNGMETLLVTNPADANKPRRAAAVEVARTDWPRWRAA
jgi:hypothetical protein